MMKLTKIAFTALISTLAVGCSDSEPASTPAPEVDAAGYISLDIALPTVQGDDSRAVEVEAGTPDEYAVKNGRLIVFKNGASEDDAKCVCISELTDMNWSGASAGDVTTSSKAYALLENIDMADNTAQYSAVAVLNYNADFKFPTVGQTFGSWVKTAQPNTMMLAADGKNYLTMTNAAGYSADMADAVSLSPLNKNNIAMTRAEATQPAAAVYVQRALAKVVLSTASGAYSVTGSSFKDDKLTVTAWSLDVKNKTSFPLQVAAGLKNTFSKIWETSRFLGAQGSSFRRVYWAIDPNYDQPVENEATIRNHFNLVTAAELTSNPGFAYCLENTFDIRHQLQGQTTRVAIKGSYVPSGMTEGTTFYRLGNSLLDINGLTTLITEKAGSDVTVSLGQVANVAGAHALTELSISRGGNELDADAKERLAKDLNLGSATDKSILTYLNGVCYYFVRVKHFGDTETPWNFGDQTYNDDNTKWLGRYGMVRNTVYTVTINSVSGPGEPEIILPDPLVPDDESDYFINVDVNVNAWAKRTHSVDL